MLDLDRVARQLGLSSARQVAFVMLPRVARAALWLTHRPRQLGAAEP
jgi:hypothetical protein